MKKISQVLKESITPQITGRLIRFNFDTQEFEGKCAMGELACASGIPDLKLSKEHPNVDHTEILKAYGIDDKETIYPVMGIDGNWRWEQYCGIATNIIRLNDLCRLSFWEIGEFLEVTFDL